METENEALLTGLVVRTHGGHYYVQAADEAVVDCALRGRLKKERAESDLVAIGDRVLWSRTRVGAGIIEEVLPRKSVLSRRPPPPRPPVEQVIVANVDQVVIVASLRNPPLNPFMLDRYLVACEATQVAALIVINKVDLPVDEADWETLHVYQQIGYDLHCASATTGEGLEALRAYLRDKLSVFTGPSGVGKSSLLNALWPNLELETGAISSYHDRGRHTTVVARLLNPEPGLYVADTPGLRQFRFWDIDPEQLDAFFPEMHPYLGHCRFAPCTHIHEPDCAVQAAVEQGQISATRYDSYCRMFAHGF